MAGLLAVLYGIVAYVTFLVTILYAIGFVGNFVVPKSIDSGVAGPFLEGLIVNTLLLGLFAIQHSVMARPGFKRWWTRLVPASIERSTFVLFSSLALLLLYWQWQPMPEPVWTVQDPMVAVALNAISLFGWALLVLSTFMLSHFELFGLSQVFARLFRKDLPAAKFHTPLLYRVVRHPIYLSPDLSQLPARLLGDLRDDGRPLAVRAGDHRLHPDRHPAGRARPHRPVRRPVSPLPAKRQHAIPAAGPQA